MLGPAWFIFTAFLLFECLVVTILVMPMPSNKMRGGVVTVFTDIWNKYKQVRYGCWGLFALNCIYFYDAVQTLYYNSNYLLLSNDQREELFYVERNAYMTGLGIFLFFIMRRMLDIQHQLYTIRKMQKYSEGAQPPTGMYSDTEHSNKKAQ